MLLDSSRGASSDGESINPAAAPATATALQLSVAGPTYTLAKAASAATQATEPMELPLAASAAAVESVSYAVGCSKDAPFEGK